MKELVVAVWNDKNYMVMTHTQVNFRVNPRAKISRVGKSGKSGISHGKGEGHVVHAGVNSVCNVCGCAHSCGSMAVLPFEYQRVGRLSM